MKWENVLEAIVSFPALVLDQLIESLKKIAIEEKRLVHEGEYEESEE